MAQISADRVRDTSTSTGTGAFVVTGTAPTAFRTFSAVCTTNDTFYYAIQHQTANEWEVGLGTYSSANTIARTTVLSSSNAGSAVNFSAGTKDVFITLAASRTVQLDNDGDVVISANSTSDALRITQTGTGNALLVEDSTNPDATPFVVDASGNVIAGYTTTVSVAGGTRPLTVNGAGQILVRATNDTSGPTLNMGKTRSTSLASNTIVQSGDQLGVLFFAGDDGTDIASVGASIIAAVDGTPGTNDMPGRLTFSTTADGASSPTERMRIDSYGQVGIGGSASLGRTLVVQKAITGATSAFGISQFGQVQSDVTTIAYGIRNDVSTQAAAFTLPTYNHFFAQQNTIGAGSAITNQYGFHAANTLTGATTNIGFYGNIASGTGRYNFYAAGTADNYFAGNVGIGTSSPSGRLHVRQDQDGTTRSILQNRNASGTPIVELDFITGAYDLSDNRYAYIQSGGSANQYLAFGNGQGASPTEKMRIDSSGNVGVGTSSPSQKFHVSGSGSTYTRVSSSNAATGAGAYYTNATSTWLIGAGPASGGSEFAFVDQTSGSSERMRIDSSGNLLVGKTASNIATVGVQAQATGLLTCTRDSDTVFVVNRNTNDGILVSLRQDNTEEGTISVSGTTVSYNGGHLSRWSQLPTDQRDPALLKGTVLSNLDEMCVWLDAEGNPLPNEQLNKMKISDVEGDVNVAGVFVNWDNDDQTHTYDMNVAMTGDMIIRIAQGVVVQKGDLLMSAGDGTAKPQGDDIIRSKTVAKVTSNHVTCTYEDGSYCVPCVLMAC